MTSENTSSRQELIAKLVDEVDNGGLSAAVVSACGDTDCETGHTILPLVLLTERSPVLFKNGFVADKVIGKGAASLLVCAGVSAVHGKLMCVTGKKMLEDNGIEVSYEELCEIIINNRGDGMCPVETLVKDIDDPVQCRNAVLAFAERLR